jgi:hypothetical protein
VKYPSERTSNQMVKPHLVGYIRETLKSFIQRTLEGSVMTSDYHEHSTGRMTEVMRPVTGDVAVVPQCDGPRCFPKPSSRWPRPCLSSVI